MSNLVSFVSGKEREEPGLKASQPPICQKKVPLSSTKLIKKLNSYFFKKIIIYPSY